MERLNITLSKLWHGQIILSFQTVGVLLPNGGRTSLTIPSGYDTTTYAMAIGDRRIYLALTGPTTGRMQTYDWAGNAINSESFSIARSTHQNAPHGMFLLNDILFLTMTATNDSTRQDVRAWGTNGTEYAGVQVPLGYLNSTVGFVIANNVFFATGPGTVEIWTITDGGKYAVEFNRVNGTVTEWAAITGLATGKYTACNTGTEILALEIGDDTVYKLDGAYAVQSAQGGTLASGNDNPGAISYYNGLIGVWDTVDSAVYWYGEEPFIRQPLLPSRQFLGMHNFARKYDILKLGSGGAITEKRAIGMEMLTHTAIREITFAGTGTPSLEKQLQTLNFLPRETVPTAEAGDVIVENQADTANYPSTLSQSIPRYDIDGFDNIENQTHLLKQTITATLDDA